jgi:bacillithiol biosynthesis cysteine-adding enzyme BshC
VRDYLERAPSLAPFFAGHPSDPEAYRRKALAVANRLDEQQRRLLAPAIRPLSTGAETKLERILSGDGFVVTTGQQAGLFGGPLYTVYKTLSAMRLAEKLEFLLDRPILPLFWVAADDHDWAEVNHVSVLDRSGSLVGIAVEAPGDLPQHSMADRQLGPHITNAIAALADALPVTEFTPGLLDMVRSTYRPEVSVASAFEELLANLFQDHDLLLMSGAHAAVKQAALPVFLRELQNSDAHAERVKRQTARLEAEGYDAQVPTDSGAANLFLHDEHGRERLVREDGAWSLRRTKRRLADDEVERLMRETPARFSANVLLRPVLESSVLPTVAYVGGPAEVGYFAQIGCLFRAHDVEPPLVFPRFQLTLVEGRVRRVLEKFGLEVTDFERPLHEVAASLIRDDLPPDVTAAAEAMRDALREGYARMTRAAVEVDPTLDGWLSKQRNGALNALEDAERKVASHLRKRKETELAQLGRAAVSLAPEGSPQERVLNVLPFLARYGPDLIRDMKASLSVELGPPATAWTGVHCEE